MIPAAERRKANDSHADCYQYSCVPEYGTATGRLHYHAICFFQAEAGIRDADVTGVQTCALPISARRFEGGRTLRPGEAGSVSAWSLGYRMPQPSLLRRCVACLLLSSTVAGAWAQSVALTRSEERRVGKGCRRQRAA